MYDYKGRLESRFVPRIQDIRGLHSYYLVKVSDKELIGFGIFEDNEGAAESRSSRASSGSCERRRSRLEYASALRARCST
jgi:hypothetical protein